MEAAADGSEKRKQLVAQVRSIGELARFWKITIPKPDEALYYLTVLSRSVEWADIFSRVEAYIELQQWASEVKHTNVAKCKTATAMELRNYVKSTDAYARFTKFDVDSFTYNNRPMANLKDKRSSFFDGEDILLSIDITSANYTIFTLFDEKGELGESWAEFCKSRPEVHPVVPRSKIFRQIVFGELNSTRNSKIQAKVTLCIYSHLIDRFGEPLANRLIFCSHDELVFQCGHESEAIPLIQQLTAYLAEGPVPLLTSDASMHGRAIQLGKHFKMVTYKTKSVDDAEGKAVKTILRMEQAEGTDAPRLVENYRTLFAVPGTQFFMYFKKYILQEEWEDRDLYFVAEGRLAKWVV